MFLFPSLQPQTRCLLDNIPELIEKTFPMPGRFHPALPGNIKELSRLLTSARGERSLSYLGRPDFLAAYIRYFLPWNLYRLCRLLPGIELSLAPGDVITDLGCGPLTLASALWISLPELRNTPLEIHCIDQCGPVLEAGKKFFAALTNGSCPWKLRVIKKNIEHYDNREKPSALVCAVNVFNEVCGRLPHSDAEGQKLRAVNAARLLHGLASASGSILAVEPGVPNSGQFISLLRSALLEHKRPPVSPCTHALACPMPGGFATLGFALGKRIKNRWCHFAFETDDAPKALHRLSAAAGFPKERAVLSFLLAGPVTKDRNQPEKTPQKEIPVRIVSDAFSLPNNQRGRYGCSAGGLVLLTGDRVSADKAASGALINTVLDSGKRDTKSGAVTAKLKD